MFALNPPCKLRLGVGDVVSRNVIWVIQVKIVDIDRRVLPLSIGGRPDAFLNTSWSLRICICCSIPRHLSCLYSSPVHVCPIKIETTNLRQQVTGNNSNPHHQKASLPRLLKSGGDPGDQRARRDWTETKPPCLGEASKAFWSGRQGARSARRWTGLIRTRLTKSEAGLVRTRLARGLSRPCTIGWRRQARAEPALSVGRRAQALLF